LISNTIKQLAQTAVGELGESRIARLPFTRQEAEQIKASSDE
jgi:hypothetical protein